MRPPSGRSVSGAVALEDLGKPGRRLRRDAPDASLMLGKSLGVKAGSLARLVDVPAAAVLPRAVAYFVVGADLGGSGAAVVTLDPVEERITHVCVACYWRGAPGLAPGLRRVKMRCDSR